MINHRFKGKGSAHTVLDKRDESACCVRVDWTILHWQGPWRKSTVISVAQFLQLPHPDRVHFINILEMNKSYRTLFPLRLFHGSCPQRAQGNGLLSPPLHSSFHTHHPFQKYAQMITRLCQCIFADNDDTENIQLRCAYKRRIQEGHLKCVSPWVMVAW